jgi:hypothetical protein
LWFCLECICFNIWSFSSQEVLTELLGILVNPSTSEDEKYKYKLPFIVSEILSEDVAEMRDALLRLFFLNFWVSYFCAVDVNLDVLFSSISLKKSVEAPYAHHLCRVYHSLLTLASKEVCIC